MNKEEAIRELSHVASSLLDRLEEVDPGMPSIIRDALRNKINYCSEVATS